jgi:hypothetical protein
MLFDRIHYLRAQITNYREQIALTAEPGLRAIFTTFLELAENELALHTRQAAEVKETAG